MFTIVVIVYSNYQQKLRRRCAATLKSKGNGCHRMYIISPTVKCVVVERPAEGLSK